MELGPLGCHLSSDRSSKRVFLGGWGLRVIPGPLGAKAKRRRDGRVQRAAWLERQRMGREYVRVRSEGLGMQD